MTLETIVLAVIVVLETIALAVIVTLELTMDLYSKATGYNKRASDPKIR